MTIYINKIKSILRNVESSKYVKNKFVYDGLSGNKLLNFLINSSSLMKKDEVYLEIGVFQGYTLINNGLSNKNKVFFGIDNFSDVNKDMNNEKIVRSRISENNLKNTNLIKGDFKNILLNLKKYIGERKISVLFIDGPHDYRSQFLCLEYSKEFLSNNSVIIIDDSNFNHVRRANKDWLKANKQFKLIFEKYYKKHPKISSLLEKKELKNEWWNGVNIIIKDNKNLLPYRFPKCSDDDRLFINDHFIHANRNAHLAPYFLNLLTVNPFRLVKNILLIVLKVKFKFFKKNYLFFHDLVKK